jgi:glycosyltransferase involved in cell wall biosynthesis
VRGLWEFTAASRIDGWEKTERFSLDRMLESLVTNNSDSVATLTTAMADEIKNRGRENSEIYITPNAITPNDFEPVDKNLIVADKLKIDENEFVIGYAGSIVSYEGLDDLISAVKKLTDVGYKVKALIVGDGKFLTNLKELASSLNVSDYVLFTGRVRSEEVVDYLSVVDLVALPRKPFTVCELVSPLKPFEAMALKIPLIVSDVHALKEIARNETVALVHKAGCSEDLANKIEQCILNSKVMNENRERAFHCVHKEHTWERVSLTLSECYSGLLDPKFVGNV